MKTVISIQYKLKLLFALMLMFSSFSYAFPANFNLSLFQNNSKLPSFLVGTYNGSLMSNNTMTADASCSIKYNRNSSYTISFSNGIQSIRNIKFSRNDDVYTSSIIYKGKTLGITVDEDGDLAINATSGYSNVLSFSGELIYRNNNQNNTTVITNNNNQHLNANSNNVELNNGNQNISVDNDDVFIQNGNQTIHTNTNDDVYIENGNQTINTNTHNDDDVFIQNGNQTISTNNNGTHINNGNVSISTNGSGININGSISIGHNEPQVDVVVCSGWTTCSILNCSHESAPQYYYECGSHEIARLPLNAVGFYKGKLNGYRTDTKKGICKIVETGCKTYRLDFSNNLPSIHGVQFGRKNNFDEYTSVVIQGQYSAAIEIDMSFEDLSIDGDIMTIDFDGDKQ